MEKYVELLSFEVMEKITNGKVVYMLDRKSLDVKCVNGMPVCEYAEIMKETDTAGRFDFWCIEEGEAYA